MVLITTPTGTGAIATNETKTVTSTWQRFSTALITQGTTPTTFGFGVWALGNNVGAPAFTVEMWGAQLEAGSIATSPIPTFAATATRAADNYTFLLSTIPALGSEYSIYCRYSAPIINSTRFAAVLTDGSANEFVGFRVNTTQTALQMNDGGAVQVNANVGGSLVANVFGSAAARIKLNDTAFSGDGAAATVDTACTLPTVTEVRFGNGGNNVAALAEFRIQKLVIVPRAWNNAELAAKSAA